MDDLLEFNRIHQFDNKELYKEAWETWTKENQDMLEREERRLQNQDYKGDMMKKLYHSSRYYVRKQMVGSKQIVGAKQKVPQQKRGTYRKSLPKEVLDTMDEHIQQQLPKKDFKPSKSYEDFKETFGGDTLVDYKKVYMNRYYVLKIKNKTSG